jgi:hypothetical protein
MFTRFGRPAIRQLPVYLTQEPPSSTAYMGKKAGTEKKTAEKKGGSSDAAPAKDKVNLRDDVLLLQSASLSIQGQVESGYCYQRTAYLVRETK